MHPIVEIIIRTIIYLTLLFFMIRWLGKKHLTQMSIFEYISGIVLGGAVAIHMSSLDYPFIHGVIAIVTWTTLVVAIDTIALKSKRIHEFIHGKSIVIIRDGSFIDQHLKEERLTKNELLANLRMRNINDLSDVKVALLEPSGEIHVQIYDKQNNLENKRSNHEEAVQLINQLISIVQEEQMGEKKPIEEHTINHWIKQLNQMKYAHTQLINKQDNEYS